MPGGALNLTRWLERLGFKDGAEPPVTRAIQPVVSLGDQSHLVGTAFDRSGFIGMDQTSSVVFSACFAGIIRTPVRLSEIVVAQTGSTTAPIQIVTGPLTALPGVIPFATAVTVRPYSAQATPASFLSSWSKGLAAGVGEGVGNAIPSVRTTGGHPAHFPTLWIPPGQFIIFVSGQTNTTLSVTMRIDEIPDEGARR